MTAVVGRFIGVAGVAWSSNSSVLVVCELECALCKYVYQRGGSSVLSSWSGCPNLS